MSIGVPMRVVFLGTGGTYPCTERNVMAIAVQIGKDVLLLDCGEGTQRQFMRSTVSFMSVRWIFITHYHGDHFLGLPGLIQSMNLNGRERPIDIYGPPGTVDLMGFLLNAGHFAPGYEIKAHDVEPGDKIKFDGFTVAAVKADHTVPSLAYAIFEDDSPGRFDTTKAADLKIPEGPLFRKLQKGETIEIGGRTIEPGQVLGPSRKGRKIVYTGDTRPSDEIIELAVDADLLIHDATLMSTEGETASGFGHSTCIQAGEVAKQSRTKVLALVHCSPRYKEQDALVEEAKSVFPNVFAPSDLDEYVVKRSQ
jgi:ribonuclease Z